MNVLLQSRILHKDLRAPNVLLVTLDLYAPVVAKVADFGVSAMVDRSKKDSHKEMYSRDLSAFGKLVQRMIHKVTLSHTSKNQRSTRTPGSSSSPALSLEAPPVAHSAPRELPTTSPHPGQLQSKGVRRSRERPLHEPRGRSDRASDDDDDEETEGRAGDATMPGNERIAYCEQTKRDDGDTHSSASSEQVSQQRGSLETEIDTESDTDTESESETGEERECDEEARSEQVQLEYFTASMEGIIDKCAHASHLTRQSFSRLHDELSRTLKHFRSKRYAELEKSRKALLARQQHALLLECIGKRDWQQVEQYITALPDASESFWIAELGAMMFEAMQYSKVDFLEAVITSDRITLDGTLENGDCLGAVVIEHNYPVAWLSMLLEHGHRVDAHNRNSTSMCGACSHKERERERESAPRTHHGSNDDRSGSAGDRKHIVARVSRCVARGPRRRQPG